jgi:hypothetical protein
MNLDWSSGVAFLNLDSSFVYSAVGVSDSKRGSAV